MMVNNHDLTITASQKHLMGTAQQLLSFDKNNPANTAPPHIHNRNTPCGTTMDLPNKQKILTQHQSNQGDPCLQHNYGTLTFQTSK